ncbi:MAG: tellurite resistance TerB family protein [Kiloniellales bacterium]|jgi:tellurite resistance protein TerB|nr:tellurite resistance TerB family protein [Kiloniellales bacterium]
MSPSTSGPGRQQQEFMEAVAAVCALIASADEQAQACERTSIGAAISTDPAFEDLDADTVDALLSEYIDRLAAEGPEAKPKLSQRVLRFVGDERRAKALLRLAHRIIVADHQVDEAETKEFRRLCRLLDLDPEFIDQASGAELRRARDHGV